MSEQNKLEKQNCNNSVYSQSLSRLLKLCQNTYTPGATIIAVTAVICLLLAIAFITLPYFLNNLIIFLRIVITSLIITCIKKAKKKVHLLNNQEKVITSIFKYLKSELEISKNNISLSNYLVLENEKRFEKCITKTNYSDVEAKDLEKLFLNEYHKNLIIIDTLRELDANQKDEYLKSIYSEIIPLNEYVPVKQNIDFLDNAISNSNKKPISLKKEDYNNYYNYYNYNSTNNDDTNNLAIDDILPPKAQKELEEKPRQFSKKYPK